MGSQSEPRYRRALGVMNGYTRDFGQPGTWEGQDEDNRRRVLGELFTDLLHFVSEEDFEAALERGADAWRAEMAEQLEVAGEP